MVKTQSFYLTWEAEVCPLVELAAVANRVIKGNLLLKDVPLPLSYETLEQVKFNMAQKLTTDLKFGRINWIAIIFIKEVVYANNSEFSETQTAASSA
jgi:hypothetical protein